jgi:hypothetical protein
MAFDQVRDVKFLGSHKPRLAMEGCRNVLTLRLAEAGKPLARSVKLGTFYLQEGSLWRSSSCQTSQPFDRMPGSVHGEARSHKRIPCTV